MVKREAFRRARRTDVTEGEPMRNLTIGLVVSALISITAIRATTETSAGRAAQDGPARAPVTQAEYDRWRVELSNWGRWGKDDEMGTLNLVTPAKRKAATALVRQGIAVSLASNAFTEKGVDVPC